MARKPQQRRALLLGAAAKLHREAAEPLASAGVKRRSLQDERCRGSEGPPFSGVTTSKEHLGYALTDAVASTHPLPHHEGFPSPCFKSSSPSASIDSDSRTATSLAPHTQVVARWNTTAIFAEKT